MDREYRASETERIEAMEQLIEWLPAHLPEADETRLVHCDFRIDNLIFHPSEPRVLAVLDWELSTLGHPLPDWDDYMAFNVFRMSAILQGSAASAEAEQTGRPARPMAEAGWRQVVRLAA